MKVLQRILGHASEAMTLDTYADLFDDDLAAFAVALSKAIESAPASARYRTGEEAVSS
ncbi:hypothetical protein [Mycobacterium sp. NBC_00419]|uniref:hypothetical protein n=1 Tax=Mycobacterium sp. NBC_00419 TaxID=2975989 RepID=UPI002E22C57D